MKTSLCWIRRPPPNHRSLHTYARIPYKGSACIRVFFPSSTPSLIYKGPTYKGFFWPGLKILADLRNLRAENYSAKGLSQEKKIGQEISLVYHFCPSLKKNTFIRFIHQAYRFEQKRTCFLSQRKICRFTRVLNMSMFQIFCLRLSK